MTPLAGRTALVTGAAKRVGREIAVALAGAGVHCLLHYNRSPEHVAETAAECRRRGVRADVLRADFTDLDQVERLAEEAAERGADVFVHNASTFDRVPFLDTPAGTHRALLERDLRVHVAVPYLVGRILGARMVERGFGRIVLVGDWTSGAAVYRNYAPYVVSKAAIPELAKVLALELGARSPAVTANAILPGPILPPEGHDPNDTEMVKRQTILGEWLGPEAVARAVLFLAESEAVTGECLRVDGGRSVKSV